MNRYSGCKCFACGRMFTDVDDVVVCPDCGTPYHRSCYTENEGCTNTVLHENGGAWTEEQGDPAAATGEPKRCARCGQENPPYGLFCNRCGMPLGGAYGEPRPFNGSAPYGPGYGQPPYGQNPYGQSPYGQPPYGGPAQGGNGRYNAPYGGQGMPSYGAPAMRFDQDSDIDGVKLGDYARYVGKNQFSFLTSFIRFAKFGGKASINFPALIFPEYYFFYRKMPLLGTLFLVLFLGLSIPSFIYLIAMDNTGSFPNIVLLNSLNVTGSKFQMLLNITSTLLMAVRCIAAIFANYWYYKSAKRNIKRIRESTEDSEEMVNARISAKGGVSVGAFLFSVLVYFALVVLGMFIMYNIK
ncbi:MAG: DUF2628 domain-containing protein [Ruminococcus sp.]|nr:DUF2628 domain-containing protein [Ruminococcus sp.]